MQRKWTTECVLDDNTSRDDKKKKNVEATTEDVNDIGTDVTTPSVCPFCYDSKVNMIQWKIKFDWLINGIYDYVTGKTPYFWHENIQYEDTCYETMKESIFDSSVNHL